MARVRNKDQQRAARLSREDLARLSLARPLRAELLGADRLADRARELAAEIPIVRGPHRLPGPLVDAVAESDRVFDAIIRMLAIDSHEGRAVSPATDWLLDNSYLVDEQVRDIRANLPASYSKTLPRVAGGANEGEPRVYRIAVTLIEHTDARLERSELVRFVEAFQEIEPLDIGELWALPIMLRVALIENVRRLAVRVGVAHEQERAADVWADQLLATDDADGVARLAEAIARERGSAGAAFHLRMLQRLADQQLPWATVAQWSSDRLASIGASPERVAFEHNQAQAADQVSIANSITSMRFASALDWHTFFEEVSLVERELGRDPVGVYASMDFESRDRYRRAVESLSRRCPYTELEIAQATVERAEHALTSDTSGTTRSHVGYWLIDGGRYVFEDALSYRPKLRERLHRGPLANPGLTYFASIILLTFALAAAGWWYLERMGTPGWSMALIFLASAIPLSDLATTLVNRVSTLVWPPLHLPRLDPLEPVASEHRTLVVVPALLTSEAVVREVLDRMEIHYLSNADPNIHIALLGDLRPAPTETMSTDSAILDAAEHGVGMLNARYGPSGGGPRIGGANTGATTPSVTVNEGPFHLLVRGRLFDESEGAWSGWERKRGALVELNKLLRGDTDTSFVRLVGAGSFLPSVTFVLTLDQDTVLPRDAARQLISTIAHPLGRATLDARQRRVTSGYGLVQPRVSMSLPSAGASWFAWLFAGPVGVDPYAGAASDIYMDVFGEGSFTGKGIYEVGVFRSVMEHRIPEHTLLSHDLLEGNFLRTALASEVQVFDDQPSTYAAHAARMHRWVRGDWQLVRWLLPRIPVEGSGSERSDMSGLHRWKILDNLRRSMVAPSTLLLIALSLALVLVPDALVTLALLAIIFFPVYLHLADSLLSHPRGVTWRSSVAALWDELGRDSARVVFTLAVLPHQAWLMVDAATRALWRSLVSHRHTLEWTTAADAQRHHANEGASAYVRRMAASSLAGCALLLPAMINDPANHVFAFLLAALWLAAPAVAAATSRPLPKRREELPSAEDVRFMRDIARRTWRFFTTFVTAEDHWLAPDNFQEEPKGEVAHRTSPTNIGLQLIADVTAHDLGYLPLSALVERVSSTLHTMVGLERFQGHFYNWYDTLTLRPLPPGYISTVDSGNLAGHLLVVRSALLEASEASIVNAKWLDGLADSVRLAIDVLTVERDALGSSTTTNPLRRTLDGVLRRTALDEAPNTIAEWYAELSELSRIAEALPGDLDAIKSRGDGAALERVRTAVTDVVTQVQTQRDDVRLLAPWAELLADTPLKVRENAEIRATLAPLFDYVPSLVGIAEGLEEARASLNSLAGDALDAAASAWAGDILEQFDDAHMSAVYLLASLRLSADISREMWEHTDFRMLFDPARQLFSIGYNTAEGRLDSSYYDMLASECRLASFLAIAKGDVPQSHWFRLGRMVTSTGGGAALVSWSASMFEYLMPLLVMRTWPDTLLDRTYGAVVRRQREYGQQRGVPWGVSESAFNAKDAELTYQYQAFGVPGLGLKRGLSDDVVIAPYATLLALPIEQRASIDNLHWLASEGAIGPFGMYEALDYTPGRVPAGTSRAVVRAYFAHHSGMGLAALGNEITGDALHRRFTADPLVQSAELLLQERVPRLVPIEPPHVDEVEFVRSLRELPPPVTRSYPTHNTPTAATKFLSNGRYSVMITNSGSGYSRWRDLAVTRYREDLTRDCWGQFVYLRNLDSQRVWSNGFQPTLSPAEEYHVTFSADKAEYWRHDGDIETHTEVVVSPEDDVEVRRIALTNHGTASAHIELTSYFEIALTPPAADQAHRAFSNLFVETEADESLGAIFFSRRPRSSGEARTWGVHVMACDSDAACEWSCETDRARFVGRLRTPARPRALDSDVSRLSDTTGAVLDPVCSMRVDVTIPAGATVRVAFTTGVAPSRERAVFYAERYHEIGAIQRALDLAWTSGQIELRDLGITPDESVVFQRLASRLLLTDPYSPLKRTPRAENRLQLSGLWQLGISGDIPILLAKIDRLEDTPLVRQLLLAHQYWRHKGLRVDLVILNTKPSGYMQELDEKLRLLARTGHALQLIDKPGGVFIRRSDQMPPDVLLLLETVARATLLAERGSILLQLDRRADRPELPDPHFPRRAPRHETAPTPRRPHLEMDNGIGGFDSKNSEYVIVLNEGRTTPAPWVNVIARPTFGAMVSEAGIGCTWAENSHENRLTTWNNDPVSDGSGESFYIRDEETGEFWSPTPLPVRSEGTYTVRHGRGYSHFEHESHGVAHELCYFVAADEPVRFASLRLTNQTTEPRELSVTHVVEWSLGDSRSRAQQRVVTFFDEPVEFVGARNWYNLDFPGRVAFLACDREIDSFTASRTDFIGRNRQPSDPLAMHSARLAGTTGRFHDPCGAIMVTLTLQPGESADVSFLLGQTAEVEDARELVARYRAPGAVAEALKAAKAFWHDLLATVTVSTPDPALDLLMNGPLLYQALACRVWGRTAFYQSSGAFGFRDQLQDMLALLPIRPDLVRAHLIEAAAHQFEEGDAQHWWQPISGRGVRTHISDDRHWLAYVAAEYVAATGDESVLDVQVPYIIGPELPPDHEDVYFQPQYAGPTASLYAHCIAALETATAVGEHGLPLIGGGDWNDGMNRVGHEGHGESVWLAWFLDVTMRSFARVCDMRGDEEQAETLRTRAAAFIRAVESEAWDGAWYRRAYYDDGTPLGTSGAAECRIDAIAQAWAVISGQGDSNRAERALEAVGEKLVDVENGIIALLTPPLDTTPLDPGYIKGYVPGVRENGGQYTHAALWVVKAYARAGDGDQAMFLLDLINPINHSLDEASAKRYMVEPYAVAADVYTAPTHLGRGGWTWYTGSASWFHQVALRDILGLWVSGEHGRRYLVFDPCVPKTWKRYDITYRLGSTSWAITIENPRGVNRGVEHIELDGRMLNRQRVPLKEDGGVHRVVVTMLGG